MRIGIRILVFGGLLLAIGWVLLSLYAPYQAFPASGVYVDIPHGASQRSIARMLAQQGVIRSQWVFEGLSRAHRAEELQAGEYFFDHPVRSVDVFDTVANGRVYGKQMVVPEGYTMFDIADLVEREGFTTRDDFLAAARDPEFIRDLAPDATSLEGFLFPATYEFPRHISGQDITAAMVHRFRQKWDDITDEVDVDGPFTPDEEVTVASMVERETPKPEERPQVASVFLKRLRLRMPLQSDPTVAYGLALAGDFPRKVEAVDLRFPSPYNTYLHIGLPPGPIANPGEASLRAAFDPQPTDYLYFVADGNGGHLFSKTLAEHNRNVDRYRHQLAAERNAARNSADDPAPSRPGASLRRSP